jgi:uncharacterized protein (DUF488 family)
LKSQNVKILIDVRSLPKSKYFYQFNDDILSDKLALFGIYYQNWKYEFGARQLNRKFYTDNILDYDKFAKSEQFQNGLSKLKKLASQTENICLMCSEIDPMICHRAILCAKEIYSAGLDVTHIIAKRNGETTFEAHKDFENRLLAQTKSTDLTEAYLKQNKKIGYKLI